MEWRRDPWTGQQELTKTRTEDQDLQHGAEREVGAGDPPGPKLRSSGNRAICVKWAALGMPGPQMPGAQPSRCH